MACPHPSPAPAHTYPLHPSTLLFPHMTYTPASHTHTPVPSVHLPSLSVSHPQETHTSTATPLPLTPPSPTTQGHPLHPPCSDIPLCTAPPPASPIVCALLSEASAHLVH